MNIFYIIATVVVLSPVGIQAAKKRFMLEIDNVTCQTYTNQIKHFECGFKKVAKGHFLFNAQLMNDQTFGQDIDVHALLRVTPGIGQTRFNIVDMKLNLCMAICQGFNNVMIKGLLLEFKRASNFPLSCPFKGNFMYYIKNFSLTDEFIPAYAPYSNATHSLEFIQNNKIIATYILNAELIPRK